MKHLGLGVMLGMVFGGSGEKAEALLKERLGKTISTIQLDKENNELHLHFTDGAAIRLFDDGQSCCETRWMHTDDDLGYFANCQFLGAEVQDGPEEETKHDVRESQFLIVKTSLGEFTVVNYNEHTGGYGGFWLVATTLDA